MTKPPHISFKVTRVANGYVVESGYHTHVIENHDPGKASLQEVFDLIELIYVNQYEADNGIAARAN